MTQRKENEIFDVIPREPRVVRRKPHHFTWCYDTARVR